MVRHSDVGGGGSHAKFELLSNGDFRVKWCQYAHIPFSSPPPQLFCGRPPLLEPVGRHGPFDGPIYVCYPYCGTFRTAVSSKGGIGVSISLGMLKHAF